MDVTGYTVQKLTRQYAVTRLATAGDQPLAEGLRVDTTPLRTLANTILDDYGMGTQPSVARAFEHRFLRPLSALSFGVLTISASTIRSWADARSTRRATGLAAPGGPGRDADAERAARVSLGVPTAARARTPSGQRPV